MEPTDAMPMFRYKAARGDGEVIEGQIEARDRDGAARSLQLQGSVPIQIMDARSRTGTSRTPAAGPFHRSVPRRTMWWPERRPDQN